MNFFLSYSRESQEVAKWIVEDCQRIGHEVWFDEKVGAGQVWWTKILEEIHKCDVFLIALSTRSLESKPCQWNTCGPAS